MDCAWIAHGLRMACLLAAEAPPICGRDIARCLPSGAGLNESQPKTPYLHFLASKTPNMQSQMLCLQVARVGGPLGLVLPGAAHAHIGQAKRGPARVNKVGTGVDAPVGRSLRAWIAHGIAHGIACSAAPCG